MLLYVSACKGDQGHCLVVLKSGCQFAWVLLKARVTPPNVIQRMALHCKKPNKRPTTKKKNSEFLSLESGCELGTNRPAAKRLRPNQRNTAEDRSTTNQ